MQPAAPKIFENAGVHLYQSDLLSIFICRSLFGGYLFWLNNENPEMLIVESTTGRIQNIFVLQIGEVRSESAETIVLLFILHIVYHDYRASGQLGIPF